MSNPFIGEIRMFAGTYAPRGWALCNGQVISIAQNTALFSLLGTTYGGNGQTTFALPDLRGRMPMHMGNGSGLTPRSLGEQTGSATHTLSVNEMPPHSHGLNATASGTTGTPGNAVALAGGVRAYRSTASSLAPMAAGLASTGGSGAHNNRQPYLGVSFVIALEGIYPSRN